MNRLSTNCPWVRNDRIPTKVGNQFIVKPIDQSCTQSPQALWPVVSRLESLWGTGILLAQDFCSKATQVVTVIVVTVSPGAHLLTKKPEDSGYEIANR